MTQETRINVDLEHSIQHLIDVFSREFEHPPTMADIAMLMLSKEISLLTLSLDRIEARLNELLEPLKVKPGTEIRH